MTVRYEGGVFENCHRVLGRALRAVPEAVRPPAPYHLGGPRPRLHGEAPLRLALWLAEGFGEDLGDDHRVAFEARLQLAREVLEGVERPISALYEAAGARNPSADALAVARMCLMAAIQVRRGAPERGTDSVAAIAVRAAKHSADPAGLLAALDRQICLEEAREVLAHRLPEGAEVAEVVYRGDRGNGTAGHFLLVLEGGDYGLVTKLKRQWRWFRGDRDAMLATLPEAVFGDAVGTVLR